ncbi:hypothetical protein [Nostoc sp. FACHB-888]|uniref:hypothetical protein n=1 Tax=Nostoc sp. FACHB-888 TaxID=2692842 RepID=UPI0016844ED5|nr:hypothetical protein [Nostoc sp. FACHB-888]MBD2246544.1 hypothetical protein [Nostoc sp. FACHB-888]
MQVELAHLRTQGIDFAVFNANTRTDSDTARANLLRDLTVAARAAGLKIDKSALAFVRAGKTQFYGTPDLVNYLANQGLPSWTHTITV